MIQFQTVVKNYGAPACSTASASISIPIEPDCTRCRLSVDTCPTGPLRFEIKGLSKIS